MNQRPPPGKPNRDPPIFRSGGSGRSEPRTREVRSAPLEISRRVKGEDHLDTIKSAGNLADLRVHQGRHSEAELLYREVLEKMRRILGNEHADTLQSSLGLANMLEVQGRDQEAEALLRETLETCRRVLGNDSETTPRH